MSACTEESVGIAEYLNPDNTGFYGRIKERFSDFKVTEIDLQGNLVSLKSNPRSTEDMKKEAEKNAEKNSKNILELLHRELEEQEQSVISEQQFTQLKELCSGERVRGGDIDKVQLEVDSLNKAQRKTIHAIIKRLELTSDTVKRTDGVTVINAFKPKTWKGKKKQERGRSKEEKFLHFTLYKENYSTSECISKIARILRTKDRFFSTAGTKDKRGRTVQKVAVSLIKPESVSGAVRTLPGSVAVGNFSFHSKGLRLGDLKGNRFELVVKEINKTEEEIRPAMSYFTEHGFINYYGMQRFGTSDISTDKIGLCLLKNDYEGAINLILAPRENQFPDLRKVLEEYTTDKNAEKAYGSLSYRLKGTLEGKLLLGLGKNHHNDKVNALKVLPHGIRQMYGHAYQSAIWNRVVSLRIKKSGTKVLEGDLVQHPDKPMKNMANRGRRDDFRPNLIHVTDPCKHSIEDVYIPLPGHSVELPKNETADYMTDLLKEDGLELSSFRKSTREYDLPGDYRNIITKAKDVEWEIVNYTSLNADLLHSQLELFQSPDNLRTIDNEGTHSAFILKMSLTSSSYATMALREIMRVKTDVRSMKNLEAEIDEEAEENENLEAEDAEDGGEVKPAVAEKGANLTENDSEPAVKKQKMN